MNGLNFPNLSDSFRRSDARNRENVLQACLGIRTSADIYQAFQSDLGGRRCRRARPRKVPATFPTWRFEESHIDRRVWDLGAGEEIFLKRNPCGRPGSGGDWRSAPRCRWTAAPGRLKSLRPLKAVSRYWDEEKVQHYQWADRGESYFNKLCSAAREVWDWEEAVVKLNRLIHRRAEQLRRRDTKKFVNPIEPCDLIDLRAWSHQYRYVKKNSSSDSDWVPVCGRF
jgi:hypothetical protein